MSRFLASRFLAGPLPRQKLEERSWFGQPRAVGFVVGTGVHPFQDGFVGDLLSWPGTTARAENKVPHAISQVEIDGRNFRMT
jgi:hypothetical protein